MDHPDEKKADRIENLPQLIGGYVSRDEISGPMEYFASKLPAEADLYIVGGCLRNFVIGLIYGHSPPTADIDLVVGGLGGAFSLERALKNERFKTGDFEGVKWRPKNSSFSFDMCLLENFLPVKKFRLNPDPENLLRTIDFTVNALVFDFKKEILYEQNAVKAIRERTIGFNTDKIFDMRLLAYRLLLIRHKIGFHPSRQAFGFLRNAIGLDASAWIKDTLEANHGKEYAKKVMEDYDTICSCKDYEDYKRREKLPGYLANMQKPKDRGIGGQE